MTDALLDPNHTSGCGCKLSFFIFIGGNPWFRPRSQISYAEARQKMIDSAACYRIKFHDWPLHLQNLPSIEGARSTGPKISCIPLITRLEVIHIPMLAPSTDCSRYETASFPVGQVHNDKKWDRILFHSPFSVDLPILTLRNSMVSKAANVMSSQFRHHVRAVSLHHDTISLLKY